MNIASLVEILVRKFYFILFGILNIVKLTNLIENIN